jgi:hypothetical protein
MSDPKSLDIASVAEAKGVITDLRVTGNGDLWQLLCKASSINQGWMKSTKAMQIDGVGCLVQVSTQQGDNVAESITFVPNVTIVPDANGGRRLSASV